MHVVSALKRTSKVNTILKVLIFKHSVILFRCSMICWLPEPWNFKTSHFQILYLFPSCMSALFLLHSKTYDAIWLTATFCEFSHKSDANGLWNLTYEKSYWLVTIFSAVTTFPAYNSDLVFRDLSRPLRLVQWFLRRRLKCEMLTDGRRTKSDDNSSPGL